MTDGVFPKPHFLFFSPWLSLLFNPNFLILGTKELGCGQEAPRFPVRSIYSTFRERYLTESVKTRRQLA
ncbi:hypothetical protein IE53DRAFT_121253 [Violaceomyces palustris]|uniref:Uncharacterized protein n=1 Tax=Violaceomyces palustris TaxID=1673888 RepID=A0ACD0P6K2_9BASI|nr:hypothetical protein IE53DRAFT_121253 [Violaceomyces palustris]